MIQFNLLPDIKLQYVKARKTKRTVILISSMIAVISLSIFAVLFVNVNFFQQAHLKNLKSDISSSKKELMKIDDLSKILTVQSQLNSLPGLHEKKPAAIRLLGFIQQVTPANSSISQLSTNFTDKTMKIEGSADSLATVNTFVDTLKFTDFSVEGEDQPSDDSKKAFSDVVLSTFAVNSANQSDKNKVVSYTITLKYSEEIFMGDKNVSLVVANKITTRSETEKPGAFQPKSITPDKTESN